MTEQNSNPASQPEVFGFNDQVMVEYNDGEVDIQFKTPGDELKLGFDSPFSHARYFRQDQPDMAAVRTESGNVYLIADGLIINYGTRKAYIQPEELPPIIIGRHWNVPSVGTSTRVKDVLFRWKNVPGMGDVKIDTPGPFAAAMRQIKILRAQNPNL